MDLLSSFEHDQKILNELKELFDFAPPGDLRRSIEDLFFHYLMESQHELPNQKELIKYIYFLINFLSEIEKVTKMSH